MQWSRHSDLQQTKATETNSGLGGSWWWLQHVWGIKTLTPLATRCPHVRAKSQPVKIFAYTKRSRSYTLSGILLWIFLSPYKINSFLQDFQKVWLKFVPQYRQHTVSKFLSNLGRYPVPTTTDKNTDWNHQVLTHEQPQIFSPTVFYFCLIVKIINK